MSAIYCINFFSFTRNSKEIDMNTKKFDSNYIFQNSSLYERLGIGKKGKNEAVEEILTALAFVLTILIMTLLWITAG
jgi:hypothetical protein